MRETRIPILELGLIAATRGILGVGIGLLIAERVPRSKRSTIGGVLAAIGALSTIPFAVRAVHRHRVLGTPAY